MRPQRVDFDPGFPKELRAGLKRQLDVLLPLAPRIYRLKVFLGTDKGQASVQVLLHYHHANLSLDPSFFKMDEEERWEVLVHEIVHVLTDPLWAESCAIVDGFFEEGSSTAPYLLSRLEELNEKVVDSISCVLAQVLRGTLDTPKRKK